MYYKWYLYTKNKYGQIFFNTTTLKIEKNRIPLVDSLKGYMSFLSNELLALKIKTYDQVNSKDIYKTQLIDINTDKVLLTINTEIASSAFNEELNHLYYTDIQNQQNVCLNLTNLITGVNHPTPITTFVKYQNKQLTINKENVRKIEISDISGRLILNKINDNPFSNNVTLPINLTNGSYLINVTTDKETFTHKLMVME